MLKQNIKGGNIQEYEENNTGFIGWQACQLK